MFFTDWEYKLANSIPEINQKIVLSNRFDFLNDGSPDSLKAPSKPKFCLLSPFRLF